MKIVLILVAMLTSNIVHSQWFQQVSGTTENLNSVYFINDSNGFVVGNSGTILKTTNGGLNWTSQNVGSSVYLFSVFFTDQNTGYTAGPYLLKTSDAGTTWTPLVTPKTGHLKAIYFNNPETGVVVGQPGPDDSLANILITNDGGVNWTSQQVGDNLTSVCFSNKNTVYAVGWGSTVINSVNNGNTWYVENAGTSPTIYYSISFADNNNGCIVGYDHSSSCACGQILTTTDGGLTWTILSSAYYLYYSCVTFANYNTGYIVGYDYNSFSSLILKTIDGGLTWISQTPNFNKPLNSVFFTNANTGYAVGDGGIIIKTLNGGSNSVDVRGNKKNDFYIYPNPANNILTIENDEPDANYILSIYDIYGHEVIFHKMGKNTSHILINDLKKGLYFVKITANDFITVKRIIKE
jgi:photosystem II stability/assembly factor-like uncharacterized protein